MGKASRKKVDRKDREASRARRSVSSFYARAGLSRSPMSDAHKAYLFANHDPELVEALVEAIDGRSYRTDGRDALPGGRLDPYPLVWATPEIARDTFGMAAPATEEWLVSLLGRGGHGPVVLDVGCGMGSGRMWKAISLLFGMQLRRLSRTENPLQPQPQQPQPQPRLRWPTS